MMMKSSEMTWPTMGGRSEGRCEMTAPAMGGGTPTGASDGGSALASVKTKSGAPTSTSDGGQRAAERDGRHEGFVPVLIRADDETLWECLVMNSDPDSDGEDGYALRLYDDETSYDRSLTDMEKQNQVLLEFRGDFTAQYDEDGNLVSASAVSVEAADGTVSSTINISNCLDVEAGSLTIRVENPGTEEQVINTDIDGKVYTTNSRTKVWNGVCAITSLENGEEYPLLQYDYMGNPTSDVENSVANTNAITLVWPGAASTAQTLAGILFEFRYCQFGLMALETGTVTDQTPKKRVVAFGAEMSPDFLLPSNFEGSPITLVEAQGCGTPCLASTNVPGDGAVTDLVRFLPLDAPLEQWADAADKAAVGGPHGDHWAELEAAGYEQKEAALRMQALYELLAGVGSR